MGFLSQFCFWLCAGCVGYAYLGYPALVALFAKLGRRPIQRRPYTGPVSLVLAARNEEARIGPRLRELAALLRETGGEIIVVSDGSTDNTANLARSFTEEGIRVVDLPENRGKASALNAGCGVARHEIIVFADVRQRWDARALGYLLENFADPRVGGVSGELVLESTPGVLAGVGLYWRYEKWLRRQESRLHSVVGVSGAICAVRRALFRPIPEGTLLDDVYWPLNVVLHGQRVVHDERALAFDALPGQTRDEFRRKTRTLAGNWQLVARLPRALVPGLNPICWQFVSHKLLRLAAPWALLGMLIASAAMSGAESVFGLGIQACGYALALAALVPSNGKASRFAIAAGSFLLLNAAAWLSFWVWITGRAGRSWHRAAYGPGHDPLATENPAQIKPRVANGFVSFRPPLPSP